MRTATFGHFLCPHTGRVLGPGDMIVHAGWCNDGTRDMILDDWVIFVDPDGEFWVVPPGFRTNGLSAPRFFWRIVQPFEPKSREASVLHDYVCEQGMEWGPAADLFRLAMRANAVTPVKAFNRWAAVNYIGGLFEWRHR